MEKNGNGNNKPQTTELATIGASEYAIVQAAEGLRELIEANCGPTGLNETDLERITIPAGGGIAWEVDGLQGPETTPTLTGVILARRDGRVYWIESMEDGGGGSPPDCISRDGIRGEGAPGGACRDCSLGQFHGADRPECRIQLLLLMVRPDDRLPFLLQLPPSSVKEGTKYMTKLIRFGQAKHAVVTEVGLEKTKSADGITYSKAAFRAVGKLSDADAATMKKISDAFAGTFEAQPIVADEVPKA